MFKPYHNFKKPYFSAVFFFLGGGGEIMCLNQKFLREIMCLNHPCFAFCESVLSAERSLVEKKGDHTFKPGRSYV